VLKDASATAIYGSRGSNGVIIITTKKGRQGQAPKVSYNGNVSYSVKRNKLEVLSGNEYRKFILDYYGEDSQAASLLGLDDTDWQDEIFHSAVSSDHNITVQGGLKNMPYRFSAGYTDQNGILKTSNFQRTTASMTLNPSLLDDHLKFNINGKFMYSHNRYANTGAIGEAVRFDPTQHITSSWPEYKDFRGYFQWGGDGSAYNDYTIDRAIIATGPGKNPVAMINERNQRANSFDYMGNVEVDYQIHGFEDLRLHANASGDWANGKEQTDLAPWGSSSYYYGNSGFTKENKYNLTFSAYAQYYKDFLKTQHFDIMVGYEWSHNKYWGNSAYQSLYPQTYGTSLVDGKVVDDPTLAALRGTPFSSSAKEWEQESYLVSFFGRANYIAFDRYMVTATVRRDGSSRFKEHWATFPSVALGWKISEEAFLKKAMDGRTEAPSRMG
jgi:iron complex outermembrane receptor protein